MERARRSPRRRSQPRLCIDPEVVRRNSYSLKDVHNLTTSYRSYHPSVLHWSRGERGLSAEKDSDPVVIVVEVVRRALTVDSAGRYRRTTCVRTVVRPGTRS